MNETEVGGLEGYVQLAVSQLLRETLEEEAKGNDAISFL